MKKVILAFSLVVFISCQNQAQNKTTTTSKTEKNTMTTENVYQFKVTDLEENEFDFASLRGKKVMIVNTASKCGLTPQYKDLQALYEEYKDRGLVIIGFPANDFMSQEPGTNEEIGAFCQKNYGVTFPMMGKIAVKGNEMAPIYKFLTQKAKNGLQDSEVEWNFQKYLINEKGELEKVISPRTKPNDKEILDWLAS
jgi:glutathione peroxidase